MGPLKPYHPGPIIGIDIGKSTDPTAICVATPSRRKGQISFQVRHLERIPLGLPYPEIFERIATVIESVAGRSRFRPRVLIDATGVGQPVVDLLRLRIRGADIHGVLLRAGELHTYRNGAKHITIVIGKAKLAKRLQAMIQNGRVHLPDTDEARALAAELLNYEVRIDENGTDRYGAFKSGTHDDLVTALAFSVTQLAVR